MTILTHSHILFQFNLAATVVSENCSLTASLEFIFNGRYNITELSTLLYDSIRRRSVFFFRINCELLFYIIVNCFCSTNFAREEALRFSRRYYSVYEFCSNGVKINFRSLFFCKTLCYAASSYQHTFLDSTRFLT